MVSRDERRIARELVDAKRAREGGRTRQIPHISVELDTGESSGLVDAATDASDARVLSEVQAGQLDDLSDVGDNAVVDATFLPERMAPGVESAGAAFEVAVTAAERVVTALEAAQHAIDEAADAKTTSNGKNSRRRGSTQPEPPPGGWVQGDQWVVDNDEGKPVEVRVWDGDEFVPEQILAAELLVLSSGGVVRLADGVVTADAIAADAIDGMVITGAVIRTAAAGQRVQIDATGLRTFSASDVETARLSADSTGLRLTGPLRSWAGGPGDDRATLDSGGVRFDNPANPDAVTVSRAGMRKAGGGSELRIEHLASGVGSDVVIAVGHTSRIRLDGAVQMQGDTEWVVVSPDVGSGTIRWKCVNGLVEVRWNGTGGSFDVSTTLKTALIPAAYRPPGDVRGTAALNGWPATFVVNSNGNVGVQNTTGAVRTAGQGSAFYYL